MISVPKDFTGSIKTGQNSWWEFFDTYVDGQFSTKSIRATSDQFWHLPFPRMVREAYGCKINDENIKQLHAAVESAPIPTSDFLYNVGSICGVTPEEEHDLAVNLYLEKPHIGVMDLVSFLGWCRHNKLKGQLLRAAFKDFGVHRSLDQLDIDHKPKGDDGSLDPVILAVVEENKEKIASSDPSKVVNFLVGQVMKRLKGQKVDAGLVKSKLETFITKL